MEGPVALIGGAVTIMGGPVALIGGGGGDYLREVPLAVGGGVGNIPGTSSSFLHTT